MNFFSLFFSYITYAVLVKTLMNMKRPSKKKGRKISLTKLSNKRLNKLAKQGKLKKKLGKRQLLQLAQRRTGHNIEDRPVAPGTDVEDIPLEDTDFEFFGNGARDLGFLNITHGSEDNKQQTKKRKSVEDSTEASYEQVPRKMKYQSDKEMKPLLPIKSKDGIIPRAAEIQGTGNDTIKNQVKEFQDVKPETLPALSTVELLHQRHKKIEAIKQTIASMASSLLENPEAKISKLKELRQMLTDNDQDLSSCITVRKLVIASLLEVFKDIIPGYKIRQYTEKEKQQSMKKETKEMRKFEDILLSNYRQYLEFLETVIKGRPPKSAGGNKWKKKLNSLNMSSDELKVMRSLAFKCLCELLRAHSHFNYRTNIIAVIVPYMNNKKSKISDYIAETIKLLFKEDKNGDVTLEAVRIIAKFIKSRQFNVQPKVLETFLSLRVKEVIKPGDEEVVDKNNKNIVTSRRERKRQKQMKHLEKELKDAAALDDKKYKLKINTHIIEAVFLTYFRILKNSQKSVLLSTVLEGLAKFAHLINVEFFDDLFSLLNELIESQTLTYRQSLHCIQTACTILTGQGSSLNIDPLRFYKHLYNTMFHLHAGMSSVDVPTALESLDLLLTKRRRQISYQRLLAFIKQTATLAITLTSDGALGCLSSIHTFLGLNSKTEILFDLDSEGSGIFLPELEDPEHCNAHNTALFELQFLLNHYHPTVRQYIRCLNKEVGNIQKETTTSAFPYHLSRKSPQKLYQDYDTSLMEFQPSIDNIKSSQPVKNESSKRSRNTFIQEEFEEQLNYVFANQKDI